MSRWTSDRCCPVGGPEVRDPLCGPVLPVNNSGRAAWCCLRRVSCTTYVLLADWQWDHQSVVMFWRCSGDNQTSETNLAQKITTIQNHSPPPKITTNLSTSHPTIKNHKPRLKITTYLSKSQHTSQNHNLPFKITTHLSKSQPTFQNHNLHLADLRVWDAERKTQIKQ